jgi:putative Mg2+ transporter-C (MgtC) family protein
MVIMFPSEEILKLLLAIIVGGLIGAEREFRHRTAGFRTIIFICLGSTIFTMLSLRLGGETSPVRIAAHMVTGVGFLCAGVILEEKSRIVGLTTAATIWFTAALGMAIGGGEYWLVILALSVAMIILWLFPLIEEWIYNRREMKTYEVVCEINPGRLKELEENLKDCGLRVKGHKLIKKDDSMACIIDAYGSLEQHEKAMEKLFAAKDIKEFRY